MINPKTSSSFVDAVLRLGPRLAVFDCDGTLWSGDAGERLFDWELRRGIYREEIVKWARARYADYRAGKVSEDDMCGEMVTIHKGLKESEVLQLCEQFFAENFVKNIFREMQELIAELQSSGCDVWAVSSSNEWLIRVAMKRFGIEEEKILAALAEVDNGIVTDRLIRVPSGPGKPKAIREAISTLPDAAFGNSRWDIDMLSIARHAFAVNPNPDLEELAKQKNWTVYWPEGTRI